VLRHVNLYNHSVRILLLNLYYPPDTSATAKLAATVVAALSARHEVTILCGRPSYDPTERRPWRPWRTEQAGRVTIIRAGSTAFPRIQMKRRVLNYLTYVALAAPRALFLRCDVVLAMTDPPFEGIVGAFVARMKGKPYVYNIRDLYPDMALAGSLIGPGLLARIWEWLHRWALRNATRVIVLGEDMRERIIAKGISPERVVVARDGAEIPPSDAPPEEFDPEVIRTIRGDFHFVLLHAGNLGFSGAWNTLIAAARKRPCIRWRRCAERANRSLGGGREECAFPAVFSGEQDPVSTRCGGRARHHGEARPGRRCGPEQAIRDSCSRAPDSRCCAAGSRLCMDRHATRMRPCCGPGQAR